MTENSTDLIQVKRLSGFGRGKAEEYPAGAEILFGTDSACEIRFDPSWDRDVAGRQARLFEADGLFWIEDLGGGSGLWIGAHKVARQKIAGTSILEFGKNGPRVEVTVPELPPETEDPDSETADPGSAADAVAVKPRKRIGRRMVFISLISAGVLVLAAVVFWAIRGSGWFRNDNPGVIRIVKWEREPLGNPARMPWLPLGRPTGMISDIGDYKEKDGDSDGLPDEWEKHYFGNLHQDGESDPDGDGLNNQDEERRSGHPGYPDMDGDGLADGEEISRYRTDPNAFDSDGDGYPDGKSIAYDQLGPGIPRQRPPWIAPDIAGFDPEDQDGDGIADEWELHYFQTENIDPAGDPDRDGLPTAREFILRTHPNYHDTDGDSLRDGEEVTGIPGFGAATAATSGGHSQAGQPGKHSLAAATLENALATSRPITDPTRFDTDGDLMPDDLEIAAGTDPLDDGSIDPRNGAAGDFDGDGLSNFDEMRFGSNIAMADTDGDGTSDRDEVNQGGLPGDDSDQGQPPRPGESVPLELSVGDPSGSHSERYNLIVVDADSGKVVARHQAPEFGKVATQAYSQFRAGKTYEVSIEHAGTDPNYTSEPRPDFDYFAGVAAAGELGGLEFATDDPEGILGDHGESSPFFAAGKTASFTVKKGVGEVNLTAYRPQPPEDAFDFSDLKVPDEKEDTIGRGVGIRVNRDDDPPRPGMTDGNELRDDLDSSPGVGENDLIRIDLEIGGGVFATANANAYLKRSDKSLQVWKQKTKVYPVIGERDGLEVELEGSGHRKLTYWVEKTKPGGASLELGIKGFKTKDGTDAIDRLRFYSFRHAIVVFSGQKFVAGSESVSAGTDGLESLSRQLVRDGYDVWFYPTYIHEDADISAYREIGRSARDREVKNFAIVGHSHGGGMVFNTAYRANDEAIWAHHAKLVFTCFIDAIRTFDPIEVNMVPVDYAKQFSPESRRPPGSEFHFNIFQRKDPVLKGGSMAARANIDLNVSAETWGVISDIGTSKNTPSSSKKSFITFIVSCRDETVVWQFNTKFPMPPPITITRLNGFGRGKSEDFDPREILVGTGPDCHLRFDPTWDKTVAGRHARIVTDPDGETWVEDLDSEHGIRIAGRRVERSRLGESTELELGEDGPKIRVEVPRFEPLPDEAGGGENGVPSVAGTDSVGDRSAASRIGPRTMALLIAGAILLIVLGIAIWTWVFKDQIGNWFDFLAGR